MNLILYLAVALNRKEKTIFVITFSFLFLVLKPRYKISVS